MEGLFGGMSHYDSTGSPAGFSLPNVISGSTYYGTGPGDLSGLFGGDDDDEPGWAGEDGFDG